MTSPSPISAGMSRRVALGATGAGVLAALTACASDIRPTAEGSASSSASESASAAASASASSDKSYKGFVKFDNFEKNGEYVPATAEKKAQNVPKPLAPANMNEDNVDGMYAFIGYWLASFNYALMTGDTEPMKKADPADVYVNGLQELTIMYENDLGWMYGTDTPVTLELTRRFTLRASLTSPLRPLLARMASWRRLPWNTRTVSGLCSPAMKALLRRLPLLPLALLLSRPHHIGSGLTV